MRTDLHRTAWLAGRALLAALILLLSARAGLASSSYPNRIKARWGITGMLPSAGQDGCLLCHSKEAGGAGTATRRFAQTLRAKYGLVGADLDALDYALNQDKKNADDSDLDGFSDYEELVSYGTSPSDPASYPPPAEGTSGAGGAPSSDGIEGAGGAAGAEDGPGEPELSQCTPSQAQLPLAAYGCQFRPRGSGALALQVTILLGACLVAQRIRSRRRRRLRGEGW